MAAQPTDVEEELVRGEGAERGSTDHAGHFE
jgi:hypothetical protein